MKKNSNVFLQFLLILAFSSCTVYRQIPIEVLRTEEIKLSVAKPNIAFVYRNFKFPNDTMQLYYLEDDMLLSDRKNGKKEIDSMMVAVCLDGAASGFKKNGVCDNPVFYPLDIFPYQTGEKVFALPVELIKKMAMPAKADYIVSLETLSYFFSSYNGDGTNNPFQKVRMAAIWNLYDGNTGTIQDHKTMVDTLYWDMDRNNSSKKQSKLPPRIPAMQQAAQVFGENYAKRFFPEWLTVDRMIIVPPLEDFRMAGEYVSNQQWDKAAGIWKKYADNRFGRLAISACYNLALSDEISDDLTGAMKWVNLTTEMAKSYKKSEELRLALQYQNILKQRLQEIEKSKKQDE
jgi:hypothetical protein